MNSTGINSDFNPSIWRDVGDEIESLIVRNPSPGVEQVENKDPSTSRFHVSNNTLRTTASVDLGSAPIRQIGAEPETLPTSSLTPLLASLSAVATTGGIVALIIHSGGTAAPALLAAHAAGAGHVASAAHVVDAANTLTTTVTVASISNIVAQGATVILPLVGLSIAAHEAEHILHTIQRNATGIATGLVTAVEITHPSITNLLASGIGLAVAHPLGAVLVLGGASGLISHDLATSTTPNFQNNIRQTGDLNYLYASHTEGRFTSRLIRIGVNGTAAALIATHPDVIATVINAAVHGIGTALAFISATAVTTVKGTTATTATAAAFVPHSLAAPAAISSNPAAVTAAISLGKAAIMTALAAHPIGITLGFTAAACTLAARAGSSSTN